MIAAASWRRSIDSRIASIGFVEVVLVILLLGWAGGFVRPKVPVGPWRRCPGVRPGLFMSAGALGDGKCRIFWGGTVMAAASFKKIWIDIGPRCAGGAQCVHASCHANTNCVTLPFFERVISVDAFVFLKGMPAVLGIAGFFVYLWAGQYRIGGDLMKGVVEKLRAAPNVDIKDYASLTPARIGQLIERDVAVRGAVNDQDVRLIRLIVILHNAVTVIVLLVCAA